MGGSFAPEIVNKCD